MRKCLIVISIFGKHNSNIMVWNCHMWMLWAQGFFPDLQCLLKMFERSSILALSSERISDTVVEHCAKQMPGSKFLFTYFQRFYGVRKCLIDLAHFIKHYSNVLVPIGLYFSLVSKSANYGLSAHYQLLDFA